MDGTYFESCNCDVACPFVTLNGVAHPVGSTFAMAQATRQRISAFAYDISADGRNGHSALLSWDA